MLEGPNEYSHAMTTWFEDLFGFKERRNPQAVRELLELNDETLGSRVNDRAFACGRLEILSLGELRQQTLSRLAETATFLGSGLKIQNSRVG